MRAILLKSGIRVNIYTLEVKGRNEVSDFLFDEYDKPNDANRLGFMARIEGIAGPRGYDWPTQVFKCWRRKKESICEILKGRLRIAGFKYDGGSRLLLVTVFRKYGRKENQEYDRAISRKKQFDAVLVWSE